MSQKDRRHILRKLHFTKNNNTIRAQQTAFHFDTKPPNGLQLKLKTTTINQQE